MIYAGHDFAAPRRGDRRRWAAVTAVLQAGLRYENFELCGCGPGPAYRPHTSAQVRARLRAAAREGLTTAEALALRDLPSPVRHGGTRSHPRRRAR
ncbi:hypothetical protein C1I98_07855 [Spongiactinospora gelatinilytica]|uniref:Uncharacterized protein n=1 Tax=Spongiactinospora gelatinilytica TaxID=2666298 RepID=A0A2W2GVK8_9ACTN|nr:hypothetical protein C1I98_07855 [Spongiactinospora gelatinilytica]